MFMTTQKNGARNIDMLEAVQLATTPDAYSYVGELEAMKEKAELQDKLLARMLCAMFGHFEDDYTDPTHYPKTQAEKLAFVLVGVHVEE